MADAARREGERDAREQAARDNQELRNQLEAARLEAERVKSEALRALREREQKSQVSRYEDQKKMAVAWDRLKGHADEQMTNNVLATRAASEESRRLESDLEQHRMDKESHDTILLTGQPET
eukprot:5859839-Pyramimonas_sp.AAC.1